MPTSMQICTEIVPGLKTQEG